MNKFLRIFGLGSKKTAKGSQVMETQIYYPCVETRSTYSDDHKLPRMGSFESNYELWWTDLEMKLNDLSGESSDEEEDAFDDDSMVLEVREPVAFSEDPCQRSIEMIEFAEDLIEQALERTEENMDVLQDFHVEEIAESLERLDDFMERLHVFENETVIARLLRAELFLADAGDFLKRVLFLVDIAESFCLSDQY